MKGRGNITNLSCSKHLNIYPQIHLFIFIFIGLLSLIFDFIFRFDIKHSILMLKTLKVSVLTFEDTFVKLNIQKLIFFIVETRIRGNISHLS